MVANPDDMARAKRAASHRPLRYLPVGDGPVEAVEGRSPGDVDVRWGLAGVDLERLTVAMPERCPLRWVRDAAVRGDYSPVLAPLVLGPGANFQIDRQNRPKGIVLLSVPPGGEG